MVTNPLNQYNKNNTKLPGLMPGGCNRGPYVSAESAPGQDALERASPLLPLTPCALIRDTPSAVPSVV